MDVLSSHVSGPFWASRVTSNCENTAKFIQPHDIRKYFTSSQSSNSPSIPDSHILKKKNKHIIFDSDEDIEPVTKKWAVQEKQTVNLSDSDEELFIPRTKLKKDTDKFSKKTVKSKPPKLTPASACDYFGSMPIVRNDRTIKDSSKRKVEENIEDLSQVDEDFEETLRQLDKKEVRESKKWKSEEKIQENSNPETFSSKLSSKKYAEKSSKNGSARRLSPRKKKDVSAVIISSEKDSEDNISIRSQKEDFSENLQKSLEKKSEKSKMSVPETMGKIKMQEKKKAPEKIETAEKKKKTPEKIETAEKTKKTPEKIETAEKTKKTPEKIETAEKTKKTPEKIETAEKTKKTPEKIETAEKTKKTPEKIETAEKTKKTPEKIETAEKTKKTPEKIETAEKTKKTPEKIETAEKTKKTPEKMKAAERKKTPETIKLEEKFKTPEKIKMAEKNKNLEKQTTSDMINVESPKLCFKKKNKSPSGEGRENPEVSYTDSPDSEKKSKPNAAAYRKFMQRSAPKNLGSKEIPEGSPGCLEGLTFVVSGILESLDREHVIELIKGWGGKVTTAVSGKTSYLLVGEEAGESKLKKAQQCGTKQLDEDSFLELVRSKTNPVKSYENPTASKPKKETPKKRKLEQDFGNDDTVNKKKTPKKDLKCSQESSSSQSSSPRTLPCSPLTQSDNLLWVDKYKPVNVKNIIGQQGDKSNVKKLLYWLNNWQKNNCGGKKIAKPSPWAKDDSGAAFKAALLSGPPGVGKTTSVHLVCAEAGFDVVELNASDSRSKRLLSDRSAMLDNKSLFGFASGDMSTNGTTSRHVLVMDEVDGMAGNEDRGGVGEVIALIKRSHVPIICMCNDRNHTKIRSLANHCYDLRFHKPRLEQIRGPMMSVCFREGIKIKPDALDQIILGANQDVRQILHHLSMWSTNQNNLSLEDMTTEAQKAKKDLKMGAWDVCQMVFSASEHKKMNLNDKCDLFFYDYSIGPLFVQENYLKVIPQCANNNRQKLLEQLSKTASVLADGDLVEKAIRTSNAWNLLPTQAVFSSLLPGEYLSGHMSGRIEFPIWLGNNSRRNKFDRLLQELQMHMRLRISGNKSDVGMEYSSVLRDAVTRPLVKSGIDGIDEAVTAMTSYDLLREDLDALLEVSQWSGKKDIMAGVETKVKSAFTRLLNKTSRMTPYSSSVNIKKKRIGGVGEGEEEDEEEDNEDDDEDVSKDAMIKVKKPSAEIHKTEKASTSKAKAVRNVGKGKNKK